MELKNKTVLITGATGGIGSVLTSHLAQEGARLILLGQNQDKLTSLASSLRGDSSQVTTYTCDLTNHTARNKITQKIITNHSTIDILINNAGIGIDKSFSQVTEKDWDLSYDLNAKTPYFLTQQLLPSLTNSLVINIGSKMSITPTANRSLYCSSKSAIRSLTLSLTQEYAEKPLNFCLITLGPVMTNFGNRTISNRQLEHKDGKKFFTPAEVAIKITSIIQDNNRQIEYTLNP